MAHEDISNSHLPRPTASVTTRQDDRRNRLESDSDHATDSYIKISVCAPSEYPRSWLYVGVSLLGGKILFPSASGYDVNMGLCS